MHFNDPTSAGPAYDDDNEVYNEYADQIEELAHEEEQLWSVVNAVLHDLRDNKKQASRFPDWKVREFKHGLAELIDDLFAEAKADVAFEIDDEVYERDQMFAYHYKPDRDEDSHPEHRIMEVK